MFSAEPVRIDCADLATLDEALASLPSGAAVFRLWPREGKPYLGRTSALRRRLQRLLRERSQPSRLLYLRELITRIDYWPAASRLESSLILYDLALEHLPGTYLDFLKLRMPYYVKLVLTNEFPRTHVTPRLSASRARFYGPFRTRNAADEFEHRFLDLFQLRRCQEDLTPRPDHPGCIYGEMNMCLRPCQQVVSAAEYASEALRVEAFLQSDGKTMLHAIESARDRLSSELQFEEAARQHRNFERVQDVLKMRDELVCEIDQLHGVAVTPSAEPETVILWWMHAGAWQSPQRWCIQRASSQTVSLDRRLRESVAELVPERATIRQRQEHLALLARWYYASWRDGDWLPFESLDKIPYRKLVGAISRAATPPAQINL